jgi:hypothetical protein
MVALLAHPFKPCADQYDNAQRYQEHYGDALIDQKEETFLNRLILEIKKQKNYGKSNCKVVINKITGEIKVYSYLRVVDKISDEFDEENEEEEDTDPDTQILLKDAKKIDKNAEIGGFVSAA